MVRRNPWSLEKKQYREADIIHGEASGNTCVVMHQLGEGAYQQELRVSCQEGLQSLATSSGLEYNH